MKFIKKGLILLTQISALLSLVLVNWTQLPLIFYGFIFIYFLWGKYSFSLGWHRGFSHQAYKAKPWFNWFLYLGGNSIFMGEVFDFVVEHRQHHLHLNTKFDPTDRTQGWWYSHLGWVGIYQVNQAEVTKLINSNSMYKKMHQLHNLTYWSFSFIIPVTVSFLLTNDLTAAILVGGFLRLALLHHLFCLTSSYCHVPREPQSINSIWVSILFCGEGYQANHHEYPGDYRCGFKLTDWDPGKWVLFSLTKLGIISELKRQAKHDS